ncbi:MULTISPECIES: 4a-hydroxytetrahydrobiopterin dehydratase [unclassified Streptomyces]|uniref:4a-hydroxytetrahydrobiopterin dehydratase n=1 Tax=unclassified Streptomyces TaxID=2593676 RepID=UPI001907F4DF|nr:4a-hydroxytetrahydrobiopterin dehydratase [Streptomyces sp. HSG2]
MPVEPLSQQEIEEALADLPGWGLREGRLTRSYHLASHPAATALVVHISQLQEELAHHAELTLGYDTVSLAVHTHSAGGAVTGLDLTLARRVEAVSAAHGAR